MSKVICVANTAGGVGKTTTAHALAASFVDYGKSVLLIDLDPKGDLTFRVGRDCDRSLIADYLAGMPISLDAFEKTAERFTFIATDSRINNVTLPKTLSEFLVKLSAFNDLSEFSFSSQCCRSHINSHQRYASLNSRSI